MVESRPTLTLPWIRHYTYVHVFYTKKIIFSWAVIKATISTFQSVHFSYLLTIIIILMPELLITVRHLKFPNYFVLLLDQVFFKVTPLLFCYVHSNINMQGHYACKILKLYCSYFYCSFFVSIMCLLYFIGLFY